MFEISNVLEAINEIRQCCQAVEQIEKKYNLEFEQQSKKIQKEKNDLVDEMLQKFDDYINDNLQNKDAINEIVTAALKICDILKDSEFYPILCMDIDTYEHIKEQIEAINNYPILKCVTPKQKALAKEEDDIIYMNPSSDTDIITIFNRELQTNLVDIPKKQIRESRMRQAA